MHLVRVSPANAGLFVDYCTRFAKEHDDSYLPGKSFASDGEYPAYLLLADENVIGAACLIRNKPFLDARKGRFMIFHSTQPSLAAYARLLQAVLAHMDGLDFIYLFVPEERTNTRQVLEQLGFAVERYSYILQCKVASPVAADSPAGFYFRAVAETSHRPSPCKRHRAEIKLCRIRGRATREKARHQGKLGHRPGPCAARFRRDSGRVTRRRDLAESGSRRMRFDHLVHHVPRRPGAPHRADDVTGGQGWALDRLAEKGFRHRHRFIAGRRAPDRSCVGAGGLQGVLC